MSQPQVTLTISDERGRCERALVESARFTIGASPDNDLVIAGPGVSRRHALIEAFEGAVRLSDCGSESGTFVNGRRVKGGIALRDGDMISITSACDIRVSMNQARPERAPAAIPAAPLAPPSAQLPAATGRLNTPLIAFMAMGLILLVTAAVIALLNEGSGKGEDRLTSATGRRNRRDNPPVAGPGPQRVDDARRNSEPTPGAITAEQVEKAAVQFMRRISSDNRPYVFPPYAVKGLEGIKARVEQFAASPALAGALNSISAAGPAIAAEARREGIEPGLVIFTALAEDESGRAGNQVAITRRILPELLSLKKTLGTESADKSLILVAAYKMGGGTRKSHPLLQTLRRVVKNPLTDRNVWFLRAHGGLDDEAYHFVVSFMALGVIAENPRRFGVPAAPVAY